MYGEFSSRPDPASTPDRVVMEVPGVAELQAQVLAERAVNHARRLAPKLMGGSSTRFRPVARDGWFGVSFDDAYVWYQEAGIRPFTMRSLAGKTIPMWVDDPDGTTRADNPNADTRTTYDGRTQVLIFRKAAKMGQRKMAMRRRGGEWVMTDVPASYPGAPGRIALRRADGTISAGNVGVRWRHPGMSAKGFIYDSLTLTAYESGIAVGDIIATNERFF